MELKATKTNPPLGAMVVAHLANKNIQIKWDKSNEFNIGDGVVLRTGSSIARYLARTVPSLNLYGGDDIDLNTEIDHWLIFSMGPLLHHGVFKNALVYLDNILAPVTFLVGEHVTVADYVVFGTLFTSGHWRGFMQAGQEFKNIKRWYDFIRSLDEVQAVLKTLPKEVTEVKAVKYEDVKVKAEQKPAKLTKGENQVKQTKDEGKFVDLPGAELVPLSGVVVMLLLDEDMITH